jgi:hypothetical protein
MNRPPVVFVRELEERDMLLGRFAARFEIAWRTTAERAEALTIDEAITWGRERAGLVLVTFGRRDELWSAGATPHWSYPRWPPPDLPPLVPRPIPPDDGAAAAAELMWAVTTSLTPLEGLDRDDREHWDVAIAIAAATLRLGWDREPLDGFLADAARSPGGFGTFWWPAYRIYALEAATTAEDAERMVAGAFAPPEGFRVDYRARPADLSERTPEPPP